LVKFKLLKFHKNLLVGLRATLKAFLGLTKSNQCSQAVMKEIEAGLGKYFLAGKAQFFMMIPIIQYYCTA